jgi:hypothetical protein
VGSCHRARARIQGADHWGRADPGFHPGLSPFAPWGQRASPRGDGSDKGATGSIGRQRWASIAILKLPGTSLSRNDAAGNPRRDAEPAERGLNHGRRAFWKRSPKGDSPPVRIGRLPLRPSVLGGSPRRTSNRMETAQGHLTKNFISNGPHELRRPLKGQWGQICPFDKSSSGPKALRIEGSGPWYRVVNLTRFPIFGSSGD